MTPEHFQQIEELYHAARNDRGVLDTADPALRNEVETLLAQNPSEGVIDHPAWEAAPSLIEPRQAGLAPGVHLGPYKIEALLGEGGMGEVYRAVDTRLGRTVAIKVVRTEMAGRIEFRERFEREARAISALNHPHICTLHDIGEQDGAPYLVMEYVEGETLAARLRQGPLSLDALLRYGVQTASALAWAHARGIIHRDLKPANLMVTPFGVKVLDFGLAKFGPSVADPAPGASSPNMVIGTPAYMSPEQSRGETLDGRSDIFALGCVLYQAATGIVPFRGANVLSILHEVGTAVPPAPSTLRPELPEDLDTILERALAKDRHQRYASAAEFEQALARLQGSGTAVIPASQEQEPEPLVGREAEMRKLNALLDRAANGTGGMAMLTGEPGIGKTALAGSFLFSAVRRYPQILAGRGACVEQYGTGEAYLPFLETLSGLLSGPARERVVAVLRRQAPTWCLQFPAVFSGSSLDNIQLEAIGANKDRMLRELGDALGELTLSMPVVLFLEDLHWADTSSVDLLRHLGQRLPRQRMLIVGTARPEDLQRSNHPLRNCQRELQAHGVCEELALAELGEEHVLRFLEQHFAPHAFPPEFARLIYRKTEGHPLFLTGAMQFLTERGEIVNRDGKWILTKPVSEMDLEVPESIRNMIRRQLETLGEEDRRALQYASVEGEEFTSTVLAALLESDELELEERLAEIEKVHRLIRTRGEEEFPDRSVATRYRFAHALYQNILYEDLSNKRRALLHRRVGETLVRCYGAEPARVAAALATHFERGRDNSRAVHYLLQAAEVAESRYANTVAEEHYSHVMPLAEGLPPEEKQRVRLTALYRRGSLRLSSGRLPEAHTDFAEMLAQARAFDDAAQEGAALLALAEVHFHAHRLPEMGVQAEQALQIAGRIGNQAIRAEALANLARRHQGTGDLEKAKHLFGESIFIAQSIEHHKALTIGLTFRGVVHFFQTEYPQAERILTDASNLAARLRDGINRQMSLFFLGLTQGNLGRLSDGLSTLNQAREISLRNGNQITLAKIENSIGWIYRELQDFESVLAHDRASVELARKDHIAEAEANAWINLVYDYTHSGDRDKTREALREVETVRGDEWHRWRFFDIRLQAASAEYWLSQNDLEQAAGHARTLLANSAHHGVPKYEAVAHKILAEIADAKGDPQTQESELLEAIEVLSDRPAPLVAWKIYATLGRLHAGMGRAAAAREAYSHAVALVDAIATNVHDARLRSVFLGSTAVQEVLGANPHFSHWIGESRKVGQRAASRLDFAA